MFINILHQNSYMKITCKHCNKKFIIESKNKGSFLVDVEANSNLSRSRPILKDICPYCKSAVDVD